MLQDTHPLLTTSRDKSNYTLGHMNMYDIIITLMPEVTTSSSTLVVHRPQSIEVVILYSIKRLTYPV